MVHVKSSSRSRLTLRQVRVRRIAPGDFELGPDPVQYVPSWHRLHAAEVEVPAHQMPSEFAGDLTRIHDESHKVVIIDNAFAQSGRIKLVQYVFLMFQIKASIILSYHRFLLIGLFCLDSISYSN